MLKIDTISVGYGKEPVLRGVSLAVDAGEILAVVGRNGSGKSTLLKSCAGILPITDGEILLDGTPLASLSRTAIAKRISYLAQGRDIPDMTVGQLVLHGRFPHLCYPRRYTEKDRAIADAAMETMGIADLFDRPLATLSGGMRQNAYIAMALAQDTACILLDEPTTYLDIAHQIELMRTLRALADAGKTIVLILHDLPLAFSFSDRIAVLKSGRIALCDTPLAVSGSGILEQVFGTKLCYSDKEQTYHYAY